MLANDLPLIRNHGAGKEFKSRSPDFRDYMDRVKPSLDRMFKVQVLSCVRNIPANDTPYLVETIDGEKKLRGCLTCLLTESLGGNVQAGIPMAVAVELIHTATLIHDDYVDQHITRRNRSAPWTLEGARRAVLIGDMLVAKAIRTMSGLGQKESQVISRAVDLLSKGALYEPLDPSALAKEIESNRLRENLYERIICLKTGILFGTACQLGAIAARSNEKLGTVSFRYGAKIGEAYQIIDDIIDIENYLKAGSVTPEEIAALAPALFRFLNGMSSLVLPALRRDGRRTLGQEMTEVFRAALKHMRVAVRFRLESAAYEAERHFPNNSFLRLVKRAPWDLMGIFTEITNLPSTE